MNPYLSPVEPHTMLTPSTTQSTYIPTNPASVDSNGDIYTRLHLPLSHKFLHRFLFFLPFLLSMSLPRPCPILLPPTTTTLPLPLPPVPAPSPVTPTTSTPFVAALKSLLKNLLMTSPPVLPSPAPPAYQPTSNIVMSQAVNPYLSPVKLHTMVTASTT